MMIYPPKRKSAKSDADPSSSANARAAYDSRGSAPASASVRGRLGLLAALSAALLLASSCASVPRDAAIAGLFNRFEKTPQVLVRAKGAFLRDMAASFDDSTITALASIASDQRPASAQPIDRDRLDKTLARADIAGIGISLENKANPAIEAVFAGDFPGFLTSVSFFFDDNWNRIPGGYAARSGKLYMRDPSDGTLHFATWAPQTPPAISASAAAIAERAGMQRGDNDLSVYLDAKSALIAQLPLLDGVTLPFDGIMLRADRDLRSPSRGSPEALYSARFEIQMKDEQSAKTYKPIMRFMWVLLSSKLTEYGVPLSSDAGIDQSGAIFTTQPIAMTARQMVDAMLSISKLNEGEVSPAGAPKSPSKTVLN